MDRRMGVHCKGLQGEREIEKRDVGLLIIFFRRFNEMLLDSPHFF